MFDVSFIAPNGDTFIIRVGNYSTYGEAIQAFLNAHRGGLVEQYPRMDFGLPRDRPISDRIAAGEGDRIIDIAFRDESSSDDSGSESCSPSPARRSRSRSPRREGTPEPVWAGLEINKRIKALREMGFPSSSLPRAPGDALKLARDVEDHLIEVPIHNIVNIINTLISLDRLITDAATPDAPIRRRRMV